MALVRLIIPLTLLVFAGFSTGAQDRGCAETVEAALLGVSARCGDLARNSVCYASPQVAVTDASGAIMTDFAEAGNHLPIREIGGVKASPLNMEIEAWGIALMNLGANLPQTYAGPGVIVMLAGDSEIVNEVDPSQVMDSGQPLSTVALADTTRFKNPGVIPEPVGGLAADEIVLVDRYDNTGDWLRVVTDGTVSWVESERLARLQAMEALPRIGIGERFPMQSFSLSTGTTYPECSQAEPFVAIQTPEDLPANLTVNGVDIHIGSMVTFQQVQRNALSLTVHRGEVTTIFGGTARAGESVLGILGKTAERDNEVLDWSGALPASEAELARGQRAQDALNDLAESKGWPTQEAMNMPPDPTHIVQSGDTLYGIARLYDTSVAAIVAANQGDEPLRLYRGVKLVIPNPGSGFAGLWSEPAPTLVPASPSNDAAD